jgi:sulfide dehydrogenase cytochrome subunit
MRRLFWAAVPLALGLFVSGSVTADVATTMETCNSCHGDNGVSQWGDVPTIAGIAAFVHSDALYMYRDQDRPCASSEFRQGDTSRAPTTMCDVVADISDDDIEAIAEQYADLPFVPAKQDFDAALAAKGAVIHKSHCDRCHSDGGSNAEDEAGLLAGQWMPYLTSTFAEYASGDRSQLDKMKEKMDLLGDDDVDALVHYYGSQQ